MKRRAEKRCGRKRCVMFDKERQVGINGRRVGREKELNDCQRRRMNANMGTISFRIGYAN